MSTVKIIIDSSLRTLPRFGDYAMPALNDPIDDNVCTEWDGRRTIIDKILEIRRCCMCDSVSPYWSMC